jgi:predicted amino acid racemase
MYSKEGISMMGVTKATLGTPCIADAMIKGGVKYIADSRLENIIKMKSSNLKTQFVLLSPALIQAECVIENVDISLNTEISVIKKLSHFAKLHNKIHKIIIMVELGDLREGVLPDDLLTFIEQIITLSNIQIVGIGCNLACHGGVKPDEINMVKLSNLADSIESIFKLKLEIISGGNSANYNWFKSTRNTGRINNLRIGESILIGCETIERKTIIGLHTGIFKLIVEVIEAKDKPSIPTGIISQDAFGNTPKFKDSGINNRAIIALGRQDVLVEGIKSTDNIRIHGSSSDHIIVCNKNNSLKVGDTVSFDLDYGAILTAMTSPFISKLFFDSNVS